MCACAEPVIRPAEIEATWLPARKLALEESWSSAPEQLRAGESITRTIRLRGEGLQGAQLPPLLTPVVEGVKFYPDQPSIEDVEIDTGLLGTREDSIAIVPTQAGSLILPEVRIPWWDTDAGAVRYAVLPAREIQVGASQAAAVDRPAQGQIDQAVNVTQAPATAEHTLFWKLIALVSTLGWIGTVIFMFARQRVRPTLTAPVEENLSERKAFKQLLAACASDSAALARTALLHWVRALAPPSAMVVSLQQASDWFDDDALSKEIEQLDRALFSGQAESWLSGDLLAIVKRLRKVGQDKGAARIQDLTLYPDST